MSPEDKKLCECGAEIHRWWKRCYSCQEKAIIAAATVVNPSEPLCIVGSDTFFGSVEEAAENYAGQHAHPCDKEPLSVNSRRLAACLAERVGMAASGGSFLEYVRRLLRNSIAEESGAVVRLSDEVMGG